MIASPSRTRAKWHRRRAGQRVHTTALSTASADPARVEISRRIVWIVERAPPIDDGTGALATIAHSVPCVTVRGPNCSGFLLGLCSRFGRLRLLCGRCRLGGLLRDRGDSDCGNDGDSKNGAHWGAPELSAQNRPPRTEQLARHRSLVKPFQTCRSPGHAVTLRQWLKRLRPLLFHDAKIVLGVLVVVLSLDHIAAPRRILRHRGVALIVVAGVLRGVAAVTGRADARRPLVGWSRALRT